MQGSAVRKAEFRELTWQRSGLYSTSLLTVLDIQIQSHSLTLNSSSDLTSCQSHQLSLTSVTRSHLWKRPQFKLLLCSLILLFPIWRSCFYRWQQVLLTEMLRKTVLTMTLWRQTPLLALHSLSSTKPSGLPTSRPTFCHLLMALFSAKDKCCILIVPDLVHLSPLPRMPFFS